MKTTLTLIFIATFSIISSAQKASWYIGGSAGFSSTQSKRTNPTEENTGKATSWSFSPEIGTFVSDNNSNRRRIDLYR